MRFEAFIGGSYESQARTADQEDTWNWYKEVLQSQGATTKTTLYPTPGVETISANLSGNGRAHFAEAGREFAVVGTVLYEILRDGGTKVLGAVELGDDPATISSNGDLGSQLFITSGGNGYIYDLALNTLTQIAALNNKANQGAYLDGYFIALNSALSTFYISALADGTSWTLGLNYAQRSLAPDPWRAIKVVGRNIWLFGETTTEIWQDTGANFPFAPYPGTLFQYGIAAPFSACLVGNDIVWLGRNRAGKLCVLLGSNPPTVISDYALEAALGTYTNVSEAVGDSYSDKGHTFYLLSFDHDNVTWAWDSETRQWSKRGTWISNLDRFTSWRPRFYAFAYDEHRILDNSSGHIYRMSSDLATDVDGLPIRRIRRAPGISEENKRIFYASFELDLEPGLETIHPTVSASLIAAMTWIQATENEVVDFDASGSIGDIVDYYWDFGDGQNSTEAAPTHAFAYPPDASWTVQLTVTASDGSTATVTATVTTNHSSGMSGSATGPSLVPDSAGRAPQVVLRLSNDGGKTWPAEMTRSAGKLGEYLHRVRWNRLGCARRRVFEVSVSDPAPWRLTGAYLESFASERP